MRILIIHRTLPYPADVGGKLRWALVADHLAKQHDVAMISFVPEEIDPELRRELEARFWDFRTVRLPPQRSALKRWLSRDPGDVQRLDSLGMTRCVDDVVTRLDPEVIVVGDPSLTPYAIPYPDRVRVLDYICVTTLQFDRLRDITRGPVQLLWSLRSRKYGAFQSRIARHYDKCLVNSEEDRDALLKTAPHWTGIEIVPNGLNLDVYPTNLAPAQANTLIYAGSVTYPPNRDAVQHFIDAILPRVRAEVPEVKLLVTGATPPDGFAPQGPGVVYTGHLDDVRPAISGAWAGVVPLRAGGGGVRFKVLEAMALGTPMVATSIGAEGVAYTDGIDILIADDADTFVQRTVDILKSPELRARISATGRRLVEERYDWSRLGDLIETLLGELLTVETRAGG